MLLQFPYRRKTVHRISCKSADRFRHDQINFSIQCILHHLQKSCPLLSGRTRYALIRVYSCENPIRLFFNITRVILYLCFVARLLRFTIRTHPCICRNPAVCLFPSHSRFLFYPRRKGANGDGVFWLFSQSKKSQKTPSPIGSPPSLTSSLFGFSSKLIQIFCY